MPIPKVSPSWLRFLTFLEHHGAKASFINMHVTKHRALLRCSSSIKDMQQQEPSGEWINAFLWSATREGTQYWARIYCRWVRVLHEEKVLYRQGN